MEEKSETGRADETDRKRLTDFVSCSGDWLFEINNDAEITFFTGADSGFLGYPYDELIGKSLFFRMIKVRGETADTRFLDLIAEGKPIINQQAPFEDHNGEIRDIFINTVLMYNTAGERIGFRGVCRDITWQDLLFKEIESNAKFPNENPFPVIRVHRDGTVLYSNPPADKILSFWGVMPGQELPDDIYDSLVQTAIDAGKLQENIIKVNRDIYSINSIPIANEDYVNLYGRDITDRVRFEKSLKVSEERYKAAQIAANIGTWEWNRNTREIYFSEMVGDIFDFSAGSFTGSLRSMWKKVYKRDRADLVKFLSRLRKSGNSGSMDFRILTRQNRIKWLMVSGAAVVNGATKQGLISGTIQDIDDRKKSEEKITALSRGVEQSPALVMFTDPQGRIQYINPRFTEVMGYEIDEILNANPRVFKSGIHPKEFYNNLWNTLENGKNWRGEICNKSKSGETLWFIALISPIYDSRGDLVHYLFVGEDITSKKEEEEKVIFRSLHDSLTGLPNRTHFKERLIHVLERSKRLDQKLFTAVLFIDLDRFKPVNDVCGHSVGDEVLKTIAQRITGAIRKEDMAARIGGDEFAVLILDLEDREMARGVAEKILESISMPINIHKNEFCLSASIGISIYPDDGEDYNTLLVKADKAMYRMKKSEGQHIDFFRYYTDNP